jgi:hypothetical protein
MSKTETDPRLKYLIAGGIGVVAIGAGIWYLKNRSSGAKKKPGENKPKKSTSETSNSTGSKKSGPRDEKQVCAFQSI